MGQSTILAVGSTRATSTDVVLAAGASANIGMFVTSGGLPGGVFARVLADSPGADIKIGELTTAIPVVSIAGPGTFRVERPSAGSSFGVFCET